MDSDDLFDSKALEEAKKLPRGKGREMFTYLSPEEFLSLTPSLEPRVEKSKGIGHEGRHRAMVIANMGMKRIPVVLRSKNVRWHAQADPNSFDYINKLPRLITPQKGAADPAASVRAPYRASGPSRGLVRNERATGAISMAKRADPDLREYNQMTKVLNKGRRTRKSGLSASDNFKRVQAAQRVIAEMPGGAAPSSPLSVYALGRQTAADDAANILRQHGIKIIDDVRGPGSHGMGKMAFHPLTKRIVPAEVLLEELVEAAIDVPEEWHKHGRFLDREAARSLLEPSGATDPENLRRAIEVGTERLKKGSGSWERIPGTEMPFDPSSATATMRAAAAATHLKKNLRSFKQRQRVAADIADPSVMEGMRKGIDRADKSTARRLAATALRGTGRLAGGALGLAGSMPAEIALRAMGRPDDMTVTEDYRQDEALAADVLGLAQRSEMPVYSLSPERKAAAMMAIRSGRSGLRPPPVDGVIQDAITDEEIQFLLRDMADPGNPTVSRPRYEAPKAAPRSNELK